MRFPRAPYVGITGFTSRNEVYAVSDSMIAEDSSRLLMVGVLASKKTLSGQKNKWPNRYPRVQDISGIFAQNEGVLNLIHYSTDNHHENPHFLIDELIQMSQLGGPFFHGFQLNIAWPSSRAIAEFRKHVVMNKVIVLQIGGKALKKDGVVDYSPQELAEKVSWYEHIVDYVLLDPSGGYGVPFDTEKARAYLKAIQAANLNLGLGVAGGLSPTTLHLVEPLLSDFPELSWDAEGRLRDEQDNLVLKTSIKYVQKSCGLTRVKR